MDEQQRKGWLKLIEKLDDQEMRFFAFLIGTGTYENLRGETSSERWLSLIEMLDRRDRISELIEYLRETRKDIILSEVGIEPPIKKPTVVEFQNRVAEIQYITNPHSPPYMLISTPPGYGKTRILEAAQDQFSRQGWLCVYYALSRGEQYSIRRLAQEILQNTGIDQKKINGLNIESVQEWGTQIAHQLLELSVTIQGKGILVLIDNIEVLDEAIAREFINKMITGIHIHMRNLSFADHFRLILAGRYVNTWERLSSEIPLHVYPISPFNFNAVRDTVASIIDSSNVTATLDYRNEVASHLMYLTGGHPGCMIEILKDLIPGGPAEVFLLGKENQHYQKIVEPYIDGIRKHLPDDLRNPLDSLSVVRRFNPRLIRHLINLGLIEWSRSEFDLEKELLQTYLVNRAGGFLQDDITRRLLAIRLRKTDLDRFVRICREARNFYENSLEDPRANRPDILAVELLFQEIQALNYAQQGGKREFLESVPGILQKLTKDRDAVEQIQSCMELLNQDWEFRFTMNYLFREGVYNHSHPYTELMETMVRFGKSIQGGGHEKD